MRECAEALSEARVGAQRMRDIVRDVKIFSRAEEDVRAPVAIGRVLRGALSLAGSEIRHRARVAVEVAEMPPVLASESRLSQLFLNLLVNAAQAIPEGHADQNLIRVTVGRGAGGEVVVEVSDTGCGIPPAHLKRLFDPFFTTKAAGIGTGLGLPICHGIVTDLGGEIDVASEPGKGSTFRVTLPASVAAPAPPLPSPPPPAAGRSAPARRGRVLVVDDEPLFCRMAERALGLDHDVVVAQAPDALRRLRAGERYDVVVTDLVMPVLTGMELYEEIARVDPDPRRADAVRHGRRLHAGRGRVRRPAPGPRAREARQRRGAPGRGRRGAGARPRRRGPGRLRLSAICGSGIVLSPEPQPESEPGISGVGAGFTGFSPSERRHQFADVAGFASPFAVVPAAFFCFSAWPDFATVAEAGAWVVEAVVVFAPASHGSAGVARASRARAVTARAMSFMVGSSSGRGVRRSP